MKSNIDTQYCFKSPLRIGTLFSGIGAFEEALQQLGVPHQIRFACDTGEIELIPLDDPVKRRVYKDLNRRIRNLDVGEKEEYNNYIIYVVSDNASNAVEKIKGCTK